MRFVTARTASTTEPPAFRSEPDCSAAASMAAAAAWMDQPSADASCRVGASSPSGLNRSVRRECLQVRRWAMPRPCLPHFPRAVHFASSEPRRSIHRLFPCRLSLSTTSCQQVEALDLQFEAAAPSLPDCHLVLSFWLAAFGLLRWRDPTRSPQRRLIRPSWLADFQPSARAEILIAAGDPSRPRLAVAVAAGRSIW